MSSPVRQRGFLLSLAAEGIADFIPGCTARLEAGQPPAIDLLGPAIVQRWVEWMKGQPPGLCHAAVSELADLPASRARNDVAVALDRLVPQANGEDRARMLEYLSAIPRAALPSLVLDPASGSRVLPSGARPTDPDVLLRLLPIHCPPHAPGSRLPDRPYQLGDLVASLDGVVYRASQEGEPCSIYFPVDRSVIELLRHQRETLAAIREAGRAAWSNRLVRLLDVQLEHPTPFLVCEPLSGGDLAVLWANLREQAHRGLTPDEVIRILEQILEGLALLHSLGLVHGDLKPSNVLVSGEAVKVMGVGLGIAHSTCLLTSSRSGALPVAQQSPAQKVRLLRGAASWLYQSPERLQGLPPDPRDDLYSLAVLWSHLLLGASSSQEPESVVEQAQERPDISGLHRELFLRCLRPRRDRPRDAAALLAELRAPCRATLHENDHDGSVISPEEIRRERQRKRNLLAGLKELRDRLRDWHLASHLAGTFTRRDLALGLVTLVVLWPGAFLLLTQVIPATGVSLALATIIPVCLRQGRRARTRRLLLELQLQANQLAADHPDEVQTWGGVDALVNRVLLPEFIAALEEDMRAVGMEETET